MSNNNNQNKDILVGAVLIGTAAVVAVEGGKGIFKGIKYIGTKAVNGISSLAAGVAAKKLAKQQILTMEQMDAKMEEIKAEVEAETANVETSKEENAGETSNTEPAGEAGKEEKTA